MIDSTVIKKQKLELEKEILSRGYEDLRYSLLSSEDEHRVEWQWRIDFENGKYFVYGLADRASIMGRKFEFSNFQVAKDEFMDRLDYMVERNIGKILNKEKPDYPSPLWDAEN